MRIILILFLGLILACNHTTEDADPFAHIQDKKARAIIRASVEQAGGLERWQDIRRLRYTKDFQLFRESGEIEKTYEQIHDYQYHPLRMAIRSVEEGQEIQTRLQNDVYTRTIDGQPVETSQAILAKAVNTSTYVVGMPFKLLDSGARISYEGESSMADGRTVDVIRVDYDAAQPDKYSTPDTWKYYFDQTDRKIVANWVSTSDHYALVENVSFTRVGGLLFHRERKSYRIDSLGNRLWLRAAYRYDNYEVQ